MSAKKAAAKPAPAKGKAAASAPHPAAKPQSAKPQAVPYSFEENVEKEKLNEISKKIEASRKKITDIKANINKKDEQRRAYQKEKAEVQKALRDLGQKRRDIQTQRTAQQQKVKEIAGIIDTKKGEIEKFKSRLPFKNDKSEEFASKNVQFIEKEIRKLEDQISSGLTSITEEKKVVAELSQWRNLKTSLKDFDIQEELTKISAVRGTMKQFQGQLDGVRVEEDAQLKLLQNANDKMVEIQNQILGLAKQMQEEFQKIDEQYVLKDQADQELNDIRQKRYVETREQREREKQERALKREQYEEQKRIKHQDFLERERKRQEDREAKEALQVPYEEELALCDNLTAFLTTLAANKKKAPKGEMKLKWEMFLSFEHLSLVPPKSFAELEKSLGEVKAKKEHYQALQTEKVEQRKAARAAEQEREAAELTAQLLGEEPAAEPQAAEPEATQSESAEPEATQSESAEPEVAVTEEKTETAKTTETPETTETPAPVEEQKAEEPALVVENKEEEPAAPQPETTEEKKEESTPEEKKEEQEPQGDN